MGEARQREAERKLADHMMEAMEEPPVCQSNLIILVVCQ